MLPCDERRRPTFKDRLSERTDEGIVQRPDATIGRPAVSAAAFQRDDQLSIAEHRHVGIVSACDDLALTLELTEILDNAVVDEAVV